MKRSALARSALTLLIGSAIFGCRDASRATDPSTTPPASIGNWNVVPSGFGNSNVHGVAFGNGVYVAVGSDAKIFTSTDRVTWTPRASGFSGVGFGALGDIETVAFGNGLFVAAGAQGQLATSPDGANWTQRTSGFGTSFILGVTYANGLWVAVGQDGAKISTSVDGVTWTPRASNFAGFAFETARAAAFGNGQWVVVGDNGHLSTSPDGITWTLHTSSELSGTISTVAFAGGQFVAGGNAYLSTSPDGVTWTKRLSTGFAPTDQVSGIAFGAGVFAAVGSGSWIATSNDGATWTLTDTGVLNNGLGVVYDGSNHFVAVGAFGLIATATVTP